MATLTPTRVDADRWLLARRWQAGTLDADDFARVFRVPMDAWEGLAARHDEAQALVEQAALEAEERFGPFDLADILSDRESARADYQSLRLDTLYAQLAERWARALYDLLVQYEA